MSSGTLPASPEPERPSDTRLALLLEEAWEKLAAHGATVNRIPTGWPPSMLRAKLARERERLRVLEPLWRVIHDEHEDH